MNDCGWLIPGAKEIASGNEVTAFAVFRSAGTARERKFTQLKSGRGGLLRGAAVLIE